MNLLAQEQQDVSEIDLDAEVYSSLFNTSRSPTPLDLYGSQRMTDFITSDELSNLMKLSGSFDSYGTDKKMKIEPAIELPPVMVTSLLFATLPTFFYYLCHTTINSIAHRTTKGYAGYATLKEDDVQPTKS